MIFKEYDFITKDDISPEAFNDLKKFASYEENYKYIDVARGGNALRLKNYVGTISTKDGTVIEILPKIYSSENDDLTTKKIFLKMLKTLKNSPFKNISKASLQTKNIEIFEIFISMFLEELSELIRKGIKSNYLSKEENLHFLKGKIQLNSHLKQNLLHKEKFLVEFDEYTSNIPENILIKTTLLKLYSVSKILKNKQRLREFMFTFDGVDISKNINNDFQKCKTNRSMFKYKEILIWCRVFLNNDSFSPYKGNNFVHALLFDMNVLFESYVAHYFKKQYKGREVQTQDKKHKLIESHNLFQLKPDIVVDRQIVFDTKWKLIDDKSTNYGLSQADLYQMYAYGKKYDSTDVFLIYPKSENFKSSVEIPFGYDENLKLYLLCFDCKKFDFNESFECINLQSDFETLA